MPIEGLMPEPNYARAAKQNRRWPYDVDTVGVRTGGWKLVEYATRETETYDLNKDPLELDSLPLGGPPDHRAELANLLRVTSRCVAESCLEPLPPRLQLDQSANREVTLRQLRETRIYYR